MDDLSNWYVRLSRAGSGRATSAPTSARPTTRSGTRCVQALRCVAPVMPFLADELWQNLVRGVCPDAPDSVHLAGYPEVHGRRSPTPSCVAAMGSVRAVVGLGRERPQRRRRQAPPAAAPADRRHRRPRRRRQIAEHVDLVAAELGVKEVRLASSSGGVRGGGGDAEPAGARPQVRPRPGHDPRPSAGRRVQRPRRPRRRRRLDARARRVRAADAGAGGICGRGRRRLRGGARHRGDAASCAWRGWRGMRSATSTSCAGSADSTSATGSGSPTRSTSRCRRRSRRMATGSPAKCSPSTSKPATTGSSSEFVRTAPRCLTPVGCRVVAGMPGAWLRVGVFTNLRRLEHSNGS